MASKPKGTQSALKPEELTGSARRPLQMNFIHSSAKDRLQASTRHVTAGRATEESPEVESGEEEVQEGALSPEVELATEAEDLPEIGTVDETVAVEEVVVVQEVDEEEVPPPVEEPVAPAVVSVTVKTLPAGVSVLLAGTRIPRTPATIELAPGEAYLAEVSWGSGVTLRCRGITIREDTVLTFYEIERPGKPQCPGG